MLVKYIKANEQLVVTETRVEQGPLCPTPLPNYWTPRKLQEDSVKNGKLSGSP